MATNGTGQEQGVTGIKDADEYNQRRRIKLVLDSVKRFLEQRRKAKDLLLTGQIDDELAASLVRDAIEEYIYLSENKIKDFLPDDENFAFDDLTPEEQTAVEVWWQSSLGQVNMVTTAVEINGLQEYINAPEEFTDEWIEETESTVGGTVQERRSKSYQMPIEVSERAFRVLNYFWSSMGMDIELEVQQRDAGFDYSDILEEGPPPGDPAHVGNEDGGD